MYCDVAEEKKNLLQTRDLSEYSGPTGSPEYHPSWTAGSKNNPKMRAEGKREKDTT